MTPDGLEHLAELCREAAAYAGAAGDAVLEAGLQLGAIAAERLARQERAQLLSPAPECLLMPAPTSMATT
ncbi:MAG: hypothetical protein M3404_01600 [Actinomycetota bacterium]|nr:hypothetical protein [Actinomycetota bacterium]